MQKIINQLNQAVQTNILKQKWGMPAVVISALIFIVVVVLYGGSLKNLLTGTKAAFLPPWTFDDSTDYIATNRISIVNGLAMVDPRLQRQFANEPILDSSPGVNDIFYEPTQNLVVAALGTPGFLYYSIGDYQTWYPFNLESPLNPTVNKIAVSNAQIGAKQIFALSKTNETPSRGMVQWIDADLEYLGVKATFIFPNSLDAVAGLNYDTQLFGGLKVDNTQFHNVVLSVGENLLAPVFYPQGPFPNYVSSANAFIGIGNRVYTVVTGASGQTNIFYINKNPATGHYDYNPDDSTTGWHQAGFNNGITGNHTSALAITKDTSNFIYVTTDQGYILKSTAPAGNIFTKIDLPKAAGAKVIYADISNNIWVPTSTGLLRSVDFNPLSGVTSFYEITSQFILPADADRMQVNSMIKFSTPNPGMIFWGGALMSGGNVVKAAVYSSVTATSQWIINKSAVPFSTLIDFSTVASPNASARFNYRFSNVSADGPWYYYDTNISSPSYKTWIEAVAPGGTPNNLDRSNPASLFDDPTIIQQFTTDVGTGVFYFQAIWGATSGGVLDYNVLLDTVNLEYDAEPLDITTVTPNHSSDGATGQNNTVTIEGTGFYPGIDVEFNGVAVGSNQVNLISSHQLTVVIPNIHLNNLPQEVDVTVVEKYGNYENSDTLNDGFRYDPMIAVDIQPYVGLDQTFEIKVTAKDYDNQPIILFNQPVFVMSNLSGDLDDPDTELGSDNIGNVRGCQPSGWMSGVNTITGCRVVGDPHGTIRYFGVGYQAIGFAGQSNYLVYNVDLVTVIDPSLVDPMAFRVTINPPVTLINTDFTISLEALAWTQLPYPPIIDIDFNHSVNVSLDGFVGTLTPATIGDGTYGTWNNGVTSYDGYQIDIVGNYTIFAFWLGASGSGNIRVMDTTDPVINGILPKAEGPMTGGNIVTITGFNFGNTQGTVSFVTGHLATVNSWTDTSIQVIVPPYTSGGTGSTNGIIVDVAVHRQDGVSSGPYPYLYKPVSGTEPNILGIEPDNGLVVGGNTVTITGTNFGALLPGTVYFGGAIANINPGTWSDTEVEVTAPAGTAGTKVFVTLINASGVPSLPFDGYTYNVPAITQIDPDHGPVGTTVNITVANMILQSGVQVEFDVAPNNVLGDNITILNATTLQVDAPLHAIDSIPVDVTVKNPGYSDITQVGAFLYTSSSGVFSMAARYYSPNFAVTQLSKLDSISIIADGYSQAYTGTEVVEVALSLFKENGDPLEGTIADPTYYVFPTDSASQLTVLNNINGKPGFDEVRSMMIRIYMYTPDITLPTAEQPWATSVILNYTLANGTIGSLDFVSSNTQNLVAIDTPVTFNMEAISGQFSGSYAMKLEIEWQTTAPANVTSILMINGNPSDTIDPFEQNNIYGFQVEFTAEDGAVFDGSSYNFRINGYHNTNPNIILEPMAIYGTIVMQAGAAYNFIIDDSDQLSHPSAEVTYNLTIQYSNGFAGDVDLSTDAKTILGDDMVGDPVFEPSAIITNPNGDSVKTATLKFTLAGSITGLPKTFDFNITAATAGLGSQIRLARLSITDTVADDFAIMVAEPHDQQTQANGTVIYEINLDYGDNFTSDVNLTTDIETIFDANTFTSVTFDPSAIVNQSTINPIILTLVIGSTPTPLNTLETFTITGTSGTLVHNALAADGTPPALTIVDGSVNNIIIIFTVPVQDTPSMTLPSLFTFNLYPEGAATKNDFAVSLSDLAPTSYDLINKIVTFNLIVSKDLLVDGATYTVYTRSTRNFWTKANNPADGLTVDFSQTALNVGFPELIAGDVMPPVRDNQINSLDASNILYNWFKIPPDVNLVCDFNNDDFINSVDMSYILYNWFKSGDPFFD